MVKSLLVVVRLQKTKPLCMPVQKGFFISPTLLLGRGRKIVLGLAAQAQGISQLMAQPFDKTQGLAMSHCTTPSHCYF